MRDRGIHLTRGFDQLATGDPRSRVTRRLSSDIRISVNDDAAANQRPVPLLFERGCRDRSLECSAARLFYTDVAQIAQMTLILSWKSVRVVLGIVVTAGTRSVGGATVSRLMNVDAMKSRFCVSDLNFNLDPFVGLH